MSPTTSETPAGSVAGVSGDAGGLAGRTEREEVTAQRNAAFLRDSERGDLIPGDYRRRDRLGRLEPRNPFGDPVLLLRWAPRGLFERVVPAAYVRHGEERYGKGRPSDVLAHMASVSALEAFWDVLTTKGTVTTVQCVCGAQSLLERARFTICSGRCGRAFLARADEVRVHRWEPEAWEDDDGDN